MGFMHATPAAQQAFLPVIFRPTSFGPGPPGESTCGTTKIVARLHAANLDASVMEITRKWPWVFKQPGRCVELPAEEAFEGFDELLLDEELLQLDGTDDKDDQASSSYSKVRFTVGNSQIQRIARPNADLTPITVPHGETPCVYPACLSC